MDPQIVTATSERLKAAGVDHIVLADGRILVEGSRESSRLAVRKWRKSPEYKQYLRLKEKYADQLGIKGGHSLKKQPNGKYKLVKLTKEEKQALIRRKQGQLKSANMKGNKKKGGKKGGKGGAGGGSSSKKVAPKKVEKKVVKTGKKVVKPAPKKVAKPAQKSGKKVVKTGKRSRD
jgi:hypothetical protein